jgi:hypothetical protein
MTTTRGVSNVQKRSVLSFLVASLASCMPAAAPPPPAALYEANLTYKAPPQAPKLDVTLGIIAPQFKTGFVMNNGHYKDDPLVKLMMRKMSGTFNEVLVAKGFNLTGPFDTLNDMTFPDKKGTDLLLYPEFDFEVQLKMKSTGQAPAPSDGKTFSLGNLLGNNKPSSAPPPSGASSAAPNASLSMCDVTVSVSGDIAFIAEEPLGAQRMWIKKLDLEQASDTIQAQHGSVCAHEPAGEDDWSPEMKNAWNHAHEAVFQASMKAFDNYVNGEEFQNLKKMSLDIRNRKTY